MIALIILLLIALAIGVCVWCCERIEAEEAAALYGLMHLARGTVLEFDDAEQERTP